MAMSNKIPNQEPGEIEALLPWHAAGTLSARDAKRVGNAIAADPALAKQYAAVQQEHAETIGLNESLGAPSSRAMLKLFAAIDAEPARHAAGPIGSPGWWTGLFASLSPRTLAAGAATGALAIVVQAGVISTVLLQQRDGGTIATDVRAPLPSSSTTPSAAPPPSPSLLSPQPNAPGIATRSLARTPVPAQIRSSPRLLVRFVPTARVSDITALLQAYQGTIVGSGRDGVFRLQFGNRALNKDQAAGLIRRLETEKIVSMVAPAP